MQERDQERMSKDDPADTVKESDTCPTVAKLQIYKSVILPHLTYCHLVLMALLQGLRHPGLPAHCQFRDAHLTFR